VCSECKPDYGTQTGTQTIKKWLKRKAVTWHICFTYNYWSDQVSWLLSLATLPISVQLSCSSAAEISQDWSSSLRFRTSSEQTGKVIAWSFHCTESVTRFFGEQETNDKAQEWTESVSHFLGAPWGPCTGSWSSSELARLVLQKSAHTSNTDRRHHPAWASDVIW